MEGPGEAATIGNRQSQNPLHASQPVLGVGSPDHPWAESGDERDPLIPEDVWIQSKGQVVEVVGDVGDLHDHWIRS
jgi:hypothetical protein